MRTSKILLVIVLVAFVFGLVMGLRGELPVAWSRALMAAGAFGALGMLLSYLRARRR